MRRPAFRSLWSGLLVMVILVTAALLVFPHLPHADAARSPSVHHLLYVVPDGRLAVYDIDDGHRLIKSVELPETTRGVRGVVASARTRMLYVSYGGDGDGAGTGSLLKYDLVRNRVVWTRDYTHGIDSMSISPDGKTIFMPDGELAPDGTWYVIDASTGVSRGLILAGTGPHNTIVSLNGRHVYLGGRNYPYLEVANTARDVVVRKIGPLVSGVRPFTITGKETFAFTTATGFLGFQVSDIRTGRVLYTVAPQNFSWNPAAFAPSAPSHGISLSPNEKELYVLDSPNSYVHVFDVSGLPDRAPRQIADIRLTRPMSGSESPCAYDCLRDGWLLHSRSGRYVYVGDEGDVIDTRTRRVVANLSLLANTRKFLEIDFRNGLPVATTTRSGLGYVTR